MPLGLILLSFFIGAFVSYKTKSETKNTDKLFLIMKFLVIILFLLSNFSIYSFLILLISLLFDTKILKNYYFLPFYFGFFSRNYFSLFVTLLFVYLDGSLTTLKYFKEKEMKILFKKIIEERTVFFIIFYLAFFIGEIFL